MRSACLQKNGGKRKSSKKVENRTKKFKKTIDKTWRMC